MRTISDAERRARLARRHDLAVPASGVETAVDAVVALHSSDPVSVYLSARARVRNLTVDDLDEALYGRRSLVRMLGMRRTLFVVPRATAAEMDAGCTKALVDGERRRLVRMLEEQGVADGDAAAWLREVCDRTATAVAMRGAATAAELTRDVPELALKLTFGEGRRWAATVGVSTRVLFLLATEARIVRARPVGSWISGQYRWASTSAWLGDDLPALDPAAARAALLRRWLFAFGPATATDAKWWTGWTVAQTQRALADVDAIEVGLDGGDAGWILPDDDGRVRTPRPWVALLPGLDPTVMGWKERGWFLGPHGDALFDRNGNAGPTVWCDGRVVGGWAVVAPGDVAFRLLEDVGAEATRAIESEAARLAAWIGDRTVTPRFRTPLERELAG
ncbi:MAG TPA: winged helix DNA-binding domain-containing protein [Actinomycetota bacterium]|nr:winged helix DNA-binding domain-containing protein [Actinomycetota bacterium]